MFSWSEWSCSENPVPFWKVHLFSIWCSGWKKGADFLWRCCRHSPLIISTGKQEKYKNKKCWHPLKMFFGHKVLWLQNLLAIKSPLCFLPITIQQLTTRHPFWSRQTHHPPSPVTGFLLHRWCASALVLAEVHWCICSCVTSAVTIYLFDYMASYQSLARASWSGQAIAEPRSEAASHSRLRRVWVFFLFSSFFLA